MSKEVLLSTSDNPWNPFTNFDEWFAFDTQKGYNSLSYLARIAKTSSSLPEDEYNQAVEDAVDSICRLNLTGNYIKVVNESKEKVNN